MSKRKFLKPLIFGVVGISLIGLVAGLSINWSHTEYLQSVGSSGVKPFIEAFSTQYHKSHNKMEVVVEAGGTTFAIEQVAKGYAQIGNASNNPYWSIYTESGQKTEFTDLWSNKKTITLGWEGVGLVYKIPTGLSQQAINSFDILITKDNVLDMLAVFSGYNESKVNGIDKPWTAAVAKEKNSMYHYLSEASKAVIDSNPADKKIVEDTSIYPYLRSGGNTAANSSIAFTYYTNLVDFEDLTTKQQNAFKGGQYGHDHKFGETDEANSKAWALLSQEHKEGGMTYMTSGFFAPEGNRNLMKEQGYRVASYLPKSATSESEAKNLITIDQTTGNYNFEVSEIGDPTKSGYNWFRPINIMIDLSNKKVLDYVWWIFFETDDHTSDPTFSDSYKKIMAERGANPLDKSQFITMLSSDSGTVFERLFDSSASDFKLSKARTGEWKKRFGACEWESDYGK